MGPVSLQETRTAFTSWRLKAEHSADLHTRLAPVLADRRRQTLAAAFSALMEHRDEQQHAWLVGFDIIHVLIASAMAIQAVHVPGRRGFHS